MPAETTALKIAACEASRLPESTTVPKSPCSAALRVPRHEPVSTGNGTLLAIIADIAKPKHSPFSQDENGLFACAKIAVSVILLSPALKCSRTAALILIYHKWFLKLLCIPI
jgi:hypothetical protein